VGGGHGRDLLLTGRTVHASEALRMGLVNRVVAAPTLEATAAAWAAEIARSPRPGLAATKAVVARIRSGDPAGEPEAYRLALATPESQARLRAFAGRKGGARGA
jgi:enoyl-CoA hydratase